MHGPKYLVLSAKKQLKSHKRRQEENPADAFRDAGYAFEAGACRNDAFRSAPRIHDYTAKHAKLARERHSTGIWQPESAN